MKTKIPNDACEHAIRDRFYYNDGKIFYNYSFNKCVKGAEAGVKDDRGYKRVSVLKSKMLVHRIIWFLHNDDWPDTLDHIDQDKSNNHIENLRPCNFSQNKRDCTYKPDAGVRLLPQGKWECYAGVKGVYKYLGLHSTKEEALLHRNQYLIDLYGEFHYSQPQETVFKGRV